MVTPVYSSIIVDGRGTILDSNPCEGNDGNIWTANAPSSAELVFTAKGLGSGGVVTPSSWTTAGLNNVVTGLLDDGAGNLFAIIAAGATVYWAYYNPNTTANGVLAGVSAPNMPLNGFCRGPLGDFWGVQGNRAYQYVPLSGSTTHFTYAGPTPDLTAICSDGVSSYARDDVGSASAFWIIDSSGGGTKVSPALGGICQGWSLGADGNIWTCFVSGTSLSVYKLSPAGSLLATYTSTTPTSTSLANASCLGADNQVWFAGNEILVSVDVSGTINVWSLSSTGTAVLNTAGNYDAVGICSASDQNLYFAGASPPSGGLNTVEAFIAPPPANQIIMIL